MLIRFYDRVNDSLLKFAVIVAKANGKWVFCKHKDRNTYELPGGHREPGENIFETAKRELYEETGAITYHIKPVCVYSVTGKNKVNESGEETFGMVFFAEIYSFEKELHSEMEKVSLYNEQPKEMTYPLIQPFLIEEYIRREEIPSDVYACCPEFEDKAYQLRLVSEEDCKYLLKVYSDINAVPFFNSDNCGGDDFYYTTEVRMQEAIRYWLWEYERKGFVRWSIIDRRQKEVIGTIELFHRDATDYFTDCGLLRLDLRSDYEVEKEIQKILSLIVPSTFDLFKCNIIATKIIPKAKARIKVAESMGFELSNEKLIGHDGREYGFYYVLKKENRYSG